MNRFCLLPLLICPVPFAALFAAEAPASAGTPFAFGPRLERNLLESARSAAEVEADLRAAGLPAAAGPARVVVEVDGMEVRSRELQDGSRLVGLFNHTGRKPELDSQRAAYTSAVLTARTPGRGVDLDLPLNGAKKLYLVADDGGDGESGDHADWCEPRLSGPAGELRLTELGWVSATTGWGRVALGKSAAGSDLRLGGKPVASGIGTHAGSVIEYDLPPGYERFRARVGVDDSGGSRGSVRFSVFLENPWREHAGPERMRVEARDLNFAAPCRVRELGPAGAAFAPAEALSASVPRRGAAFFQVAPGPVVPRDAIRSGEVWSDTEGRVIQAHGGGILFHEGVYYWYGEYKDGPTRRSPVDRVDVIGVSCYSSRDLLNWKYEGLVLKGVDRPGHDLRPEMVLERPKVVFNRKTGKFVMWAHIDSADYGYARGGVAVADSPAGPFTYLGSVRPEGRMCRDMTVFVDDDGSAYHVYASENNATILISKLSEDYTAHTGVYAKAFENKFWEAPALFKHDGRYYMIASGQSGWAPNPARSAVAPTPMGPWTELGNPCSGPKAGTTYDSQSTHVLPIAGKPGAYVFLADRWNPQNLRDSRYVWLPVRFEDGKPKVDWVDTWSPAKL